MSGAPLEFRLSPATSALVVVDLQYGSAARGHGYDISHRTPETAEVLDAYFDRVVNVAVPNVRRLLDAFRGAGATVIFLRVGPSGATVGEAPVGRKFRLGWAERTLPTPGEMDLLAEIAPKPGERIITKTSASAFTTTNFEQVITDLGLEELVFCGVATSYCVESTLRDAADRGFCCMLVEDGCADAREEYHQMGVAISARFARVASTDSVIEELVA